MGVKQAAVAPGTNTDPGDSVLVLSPSLDEATNSACVDLLDPIDSDQTRVLWVTVHESPNERIAHWAAHHDEPPVDAAILDILAGGDRSTDGGGPTLFDEPVSVTEVTAPHNLTRIGVEIVDQLDRWNRANDAQIVVCFHSLTSFLQYVDTQEAFKFLHALTNQLSRTGAIAHFHMDPGAHDERTINTVMPVFRRVAQLDGDEWTHRSR